MAEVRTLQGVVASTRDVRRIVGTRAARAQAIRRLTAEAAAKDADATASRAVRACAHVDICMGYR